MEQFASQNAGKIKVVGIGTQDDRDLADGFQRAAGAETAQLVWSSGTDVWKHFNVSSQHTTILLDKDGKELQRWRNFEPSSVADAFPS